MIPFRFPVASFAIVCSCFSAAAATAQSPLRLTDPSPQRYRIRARASELDPRARSYPEIGFVFQDARGKPQDVQNASVDTRVPPRGKLVLWLMSHNGELFDRINSYGIHAIQPHYANKWFGTCCQENPVGQHCRGNLRLEAATGEDFSDEVAIAKPDGMVERARQMLMHLAETHPQGGWDFFLDENQSIRWEDVIVAGSSHGSTTASRFSKHQKVSRVVAFCGPRDQYQSWQSLRSATPAERVFAFSHVLDSGWTGDHYCRSWELMGLNEHGPIVNVDQTKFPYGNTRRLVTDFDVQGDSKRAHGAVLPGKRAAKSADGSYQHEDVWRYLFTHPVHLTGEAVAMDDGCQKQH